MPKTYEGQGLSFQYPDNWELEQTQDDESSLQVTVSSPNTAFWSLSVYPGVRDVRGLLDEMLQAMQAEYPAAEHDAADSWIDKTPLVGYDVNFYYLDLTNTAQLRVFHHGESTCVVLAQCEDHELTAAAQIFAAMTTSLLTN